MLKSRQLWKYRGRYASDPDAQDAKLECGSLIKMAARGLGTLNSFQEKSQRTDGAHGPPQGIILGDQLSKSHELAPKK
jgi:hypothetical protein